CAATPSHTRPRSTSPGPSAARSSWLPRVSCSPVIVRLHPASARRAAKPLASADAPGARGSSLCLRERPSAQPPQRPSGPPRTSAASPHAPRCPPARAPRRRRRLPPPTRLLPPDRPVAARRRQPGQAAAVRPGRGGAAPPPPAGGRSPTASRPPSPPAGNRAHPATPPGTSPAARPPHRRPAARHAAAPRATARAGRTTPAARCRRQPPRRRSARWRPSLLCCILTAAGSRRRKEFQPDPAAALRRSSPASTYAPGGHLDPADPGLLAAALRELAEETCISWQQAASPPGLDASRSTSTCTTTLPTRPKEPAHWHADFRFAFFVTDPAVLLQLEEVSGYAWLTPSPGP